MADQAGLRKGDTPAEAGSTNTVKFSSTLPSRPRDSHEGPSNLSSQNRPENLQRTTSDESDDLPPHFRSSVVDVPVTPGIGTATYFSLDSSRDSTMHGTQDAGSPSYFSAQTPHDDVVASPDPLDDNMAAVTPVGADSAPISGHDILRRMSKSRRNRRESVDDIRTAYPSLSLSGNVISATFNMPHSLKYRKGADWVSAHNWTQLILAPSRSEQHLLMQLLRRNSNPAVDNRLCLTP